MRKIISVLLILIAVTSNAQTVQDFFNPNYRSIYWLGIDFSHAKLIGDFSQFGGAGTQSYHQIRDKFFKSWNNILISEKDKYDLKKMLDKKYIRYDIDMIMDLNYNTNPEEIEAFSRPEYTDEDIKNFVSEYNTEGKNGTGILLIAEYLDKNEEKALYHFIALNMSTKEILIHDKITAKPGGFGLRNYWAGSLNDLIKTVKKKRYKEWMKTYN